MHIRIYQTQDESNIIALWDLCGLLVPHNNPYLDIERKLVRDGELFFVGEIDGEIMASIMVGYDGHRGWVNYLAVHPDHQGQDYGRRLMILAEDQLTALGCPKLNLQVRSSNKKVLQFYEALGYEPDHAVGLGKRLIEDDAYSV